MPSFKRFLVDKRGFVAAEKILLTLIALGAVLLVGRYIVLGTNKAATNVQKTLESSSPGPSQRP